MKDLRTLRPLLIACAASLIGQARVQGQTQHAYRVIALQGDATPSVGATTTYGILGTSPRIGSDGHITFGGFVGNNGNANYAIWTGLAGEIVALAVKGDATPGRPGETLDIFAFSSGANYWPCIDGSVAFRSTSEPSGNDGIWHGTPDDLRAVAIVNSATPSIAGTTIKNFPGLVYPANGDGEVLVRATIEGGGVSSDDDTVLWVSRPGSVQQIAREGEDARLTVASGAKGFPNPDPTWLQMERYRKAAHEQQRRDCIRSRSKSGR